MHQLLDLTGLLLLDCTQLCIQILPVFGNQTIVFNFQPADIGFVLFPLDEVADYLQKHGTTCNGTNGEFQDFNHC